MGSGSQWYPQPSSIPSKVFTLDAIAAHDGINRPTIYTHIDGKVYDITTFIPSHPGGASKIMLAAGKGVEGFWDVYRQHLNEGREGVQDALRGRCIGTVDEGDMRRLKEARLGREDANGGPYASDPKDRFPGLIFHSKTPCCAETPAELLGETYLTPNELFYIRSHHPVPPALKQRTRSHSHSLSHRSLSEGADEGEVSSASSAPSSDPRRAADLARRLSEKALLITRRISASHNGGVVTSGENEDEDEDEEGTPIAIALSDEDLVPLTVDLTCIGGGLRVLTLGDLKRDYPKVSVVATLQCSGNRRLGMNAVAKTSGSPWAGGAIGTAKWSGARLRDVIEREASEAHKERRSALGSGGPNLQPNLHTPNLESLLESNGVEHCVFEGRDGMSASVDIDKAIGHNKDTIIAYSMNDSPIPPDHGWPMRVIVPGYVGVRNVKWLSCVRPSNEEAEGDWQRGVNYKLLPPSVRDARDAEPGGLPAMQEAGLFSAITGAEGEREGEGEGRARARARSRGWAVAGGGRGIIRVDVTGDGGARWKSATLLTGSSQAAGRAWGWTTWEVDGVECDLDEEGYGEIMCRAVDTSCNVQPREVGEIWNMRGLSNNSWFRQKVKFEEEEEEEEEEDEEEQ